MLPFIRHGIKPLRPFIARYNFFSTTRILPQAQPKTYRPLNSSSSSSSTSSLSTPSSFIQPSRNLTSKFTSSDEKVVLWKLYATFNRHNTHLSMVAVVEDLNFMQKNAHLSYTEKVLYYLQLPHQPKIHISAGQLGFRKAQRAEYEAGYQVSARMFKMIQEKNLLKPNDKVELVLKNYGKGREAFLNALQGKEGSSVREQIVRISENTKLKFGGTRPKKLRRL